MARSICISTGPVPEVMRASGTWKSEQFPTTFSMWTQQLLQRQRRMVVSENFGSNDPTENFIDVYMDAVGQLWEQNVFIVPFHVLRRKVLFVVSELKVCETAMLTSLAYMQRLRRCFDENNISVQRIDGRAYELLIVCLLGATKFLYDIPYSNAQWAETSGINKKLLNQLELELLESFKYSLVICGEEIEEIKRDLEQGCAFSCRPPENTYYPQRFGFPCTPSPPVRTGLSSITPQGPYCYYPENVQSVEQLPARPQQYELWSTAGAAQKLCNTNPTLDGVATRLVFDQLPAHDNNSPNSFSLFQYLPTPPISNLSLVSSSPLSQSKHLKMRSKSPTWNDGATNYIEQGKPRLSRLPPCGTKVRHKSLPLPPVRSSYANFLPPPAQDCLTHPQFYSALPTTPAPRSCISCNSQGPCLCNALANDARYNFHPSNPEPTYPVYHNPNIIGPPYPYPTYQPMGFWGGGMPNNWSSYFSHTAY